MRLARNPVADRLLYVSRQYKDLAVLEWAALAALHLQGLVDDVEIEGIRPEDIEELRGTFGSNPHESRLPWFAREVNKVYKKANKAKRRVSDEDLMFLHELAENLEAISVWADTEKLDLGGVSGEDALAGATDWRPPGPPEEAPVVYVFDDGWTVQRLETWRQIFDEGEEMQHCLRNDTDGFFKAVEDGETHLFSLRDLEGTRT